MITLFGNLESGNVHKVQMILHRLAIAFERVDVSQVNDEPRRPEFLRLNAMGKVPVVSLDDGDVLSESGAIPSPRRWRLHRIESTSSSSKHTALSRRSKMAFGGRA